MSLVTVLTATYNREKELHNLYISLCEQTSKNFEWLVVDDGSKDNTESYICSIQENAPFKIRYIKKNNGGKHTALNVGIRVIETELTIIVDSDDTLLKDAIETIECYQDNYDQHSLGAMTFLRCDKNKKAIVSLEQEEFVTSYVEYRIKGNRPGDMAEVFFSKVLKEFPFPEFEGEKFLSEDVVWIAIGEKYKFLFINKPIYQCEYLNDGLTSNDKKMKFASPLGSMLRGKMLMRPACGWKVNIKGAIIYNCYKLEVSKVIPDELALETIQEKSMVLLTKFIGKIFNKKWKSSLDDLKKGKCV